MIRYSKLRFKHEILQQYYLGCLLVIGLLGGFGIPHNVYAQDFRISDIEVIGTSELEIAQILFSLESQVNESLDRRKIRRDIHVIYELGLFQDVRAEVSSQDKGYLLRFVVLERPRITAIHFEGRTLISKNDLLKDITIKPMDIYDLVKINANEKVIQDAYRKDGFARASVSSRTDKISDQEYEVTFVINESPKSYLTDIHIQGTSVFSELDIKRFMLSTEIDCFSWINESGIFQEERINQDLQLIVQHYLKEGYIKVFIDKPDITLYHNSDYSRLEVQLHIKEGPQYFAGKIDITGDILGSEELTVQQRKEKLMELLKLTEGAVYDPFLQNQDRSVLNEAYQEQGYAFVRVIPRTNIHEDSRTVDVAYNIVKKEKAYIGRLEIAGNAETRDYVVRREFSVGENELYNGKKLRLSQNNLERLGFFEPGMAMERNPREDEDNLLDIITRLKETQTGSFQAQLGYSEQSRLSGGISLSKGNLYGRGQTLRLSLQFSERDVTNDFSLTFIEPRLWGTQVSTSFSIAHKRSDDTTGLNRGTITENSFSVSLGQAIYRQIRLSALYSALNRFFKGDEPHVFKRSISPTLSYDTVNHPLFPSEGLKTSFTIIHTGTPLGGNTQYEEFLYSYQQFWSLNESRTLIMMARARIGLLERVGDFEIPSEDRYRIGGINSVRGHDFYAIAGPFSSIERRKNNTSQAVINEFGEPQEQGLGGFDKRTAGLTPDELKQLESGGISQRIFNLELLFPLSQDEKSFVRGVVFLDAGNVNAEPIQYELLGEKEPEFFDLRRSAGLGVRLITPVGVLRFEYGVKIDRQSGESPDRFEFNISGLF
ncbi:outer membrane protein assembly factor BamA [Deltaproteobacteria bacterium TL4]